MYIGIIIPSHGLSDKLERCLDHLTESITKHALFIAVIDNGTTDDSVYDVCRKSPYWDTDIINFTYVRLPWNASFARASNTGLHVLGQVDAYLFLNNDCYIDPHCLDNMVSALKSGHGEIIGAKLLYPDGTAQHAGGDIIGNWTAVSHRFRGHPGDDPAINKSKNVPWVTAACMLVRAKTFVKFGGFAEVFVNGYEDVDLCLRFSQKSYKVYYCAEAIGIHEEAQTPGRKEHEADNAARFFNHWRRFDPETLR